MNAENQNGNANSLNGNNVNGDAYSGLAKWGQLTSVGGSIIITIFSIFLIFKGISVLRDNHPWLSISGRVESVRCNLITPQNGPAYNACQLTVSYKIGDRDFTVTAMHKSDLPPQVGDAMKIYYNPSNPSDSSMDSPVSKGTAKLMIAGGVFLILISWLWTWIVFKNKFIAGAMGVRSLVR
jgi:hypothetical protein